MKYKSKQTLLYSRFDHNEKVQYAERRQTYTAQDCGLIRQVKN